MDTSQPLRDTIIESLRSGQLRAGDRLPTERAFCEQYRISRTTVRKVLQELKERELISQTVGSGTYVTEHAAQKLASMAADASASQISPAVLMEARLALEPAIVEMVIGNATAADFEQMESCCAKAEAAASNEEFEVWDGLLHERIAQAAHNAFVANVFALMNQARAQGEWGMLKKRSLTPERRLAYQQEHRALVQAIKNRDPALARERATEHLLHVRRNLLNY
ncbi:MAG: FCD domain-containing protein [Burkholderiaceae bacterium]|nr:FadR family transcriptional regulator [Rhodoferax sp.]MCP5262957.1 FadR family transcriptional regulator [Rhodoferax sp.]MCW5628400.1 FadR family transcriptional regulator [Rhodoferax sp.]MCW5641838.1 FadR family transcriptional regulator [Rhodoferax sp.]